MEERRKRLEELYKKEQEAWAASPKKEIPVEDDLERARKIDARRKEGARANARVTRRDHRGDGAGKTQGLDAREGIAVDERDERRFVVLFCDERPREHFAVSPRRGERREGRL